MRSYRGIRSDSAGSTAIEDLRMLQARAIPGLL